jgi:hypothetical protein
MPRQNNPTTILRERRPYAKVVPGYGTGRGRELAVVAHGD